MASGPAAAAARPVRALTSRPVAGIALLVVAALGLLLVAVVALSHGEQRRAGTNGVVIAAKSPVEAGTEICQPALVLPAGAAAVQLSLTPLASSGGVPLDVSLRSGTRTLARERVAGGWSGSTVTVPLTGAAGASEVDGLSVCATPRGGSVMVEVGRTPRAQSSLTLGGDATAVSMRVEFLRAGSESWWAFAPTLMRHVANAHGGWSAPLVAVALVGGLLASWAIAFTVLARAIVLPRAAAAGWAILALGALNAGLWTIVTPPFYGPDEITHFAYVQVIGETGRPPVETAHPRYSEELSTTMAAAHADERIPELRAAMWSEAEVDRLQRAEHGGLAREGDGSAKASNPEPPLYYALAAVPYAAARSSSLLTRLQLIRLFGALLGGVAALFVFLFARECLPSRPWAAVAGGLVVAFMPLPGFVSGSVNPDALLFPASAALFYCVARAFRRGLDRRLAIWIGVVIAIGLLGKINFYGLLPGAALAIVFGAWRSAGGDRRAAARLIGTVAAVSLAPFVLLYLLDAALWDRTNILWRDTSAASADHGGPLRQLGFLWQVYLPPLPGMHVEFPGHYIGYEIWFKTWVGTFSGSLVRFTDWGYQLACAVVLAVAALAGWTAVRERRELRRRLPELGGYAAMVGGLLLLIALVALRGWAPSIGAAAQGRYLLPLGALVAACVALAVRGPGERWGRAVAVLLVVATVAWSFLAQLLMLQHFYA